MWAEARGDAARAKVRKTGEPGGTKARDAAAVANKAERLTFAGLGAALICGVELIWNPEPGHRWPGWRSDPAQNIEDADLALFFRT